jgi:hypothetical protein
LDPASRDRRHVRSDRLEWLDVPLPAVPRAGRDHSQRDANLDAGRHHLRSDTIQQESPVSFGGVAGTIPSRFAIEPVAEKANASDLIRINYRNTNAAANTVNGIIQITRLPPAADKTK